jgi:uncharacterized protein YrrD
MLRTAKQLTGLRMGATDGEIGRVHEFLFDDKHWTIRYLVADTGGWLAGRQVLISPVALEPVNELEGVLPVRLTRARIEESPPVSSELPVSRQHEVEFLGYYGWPNYWYGPLAWGASAYPLPYAPAPEADRVADEAAGDPHLRSTSAVTGYHISAKDGEIGHVDDFIIDDESWAIRYLVVDTRNWWFGKQVVIAPQWISHIDWAESKVSVDLTRDEIKAAPEYEGVDRHQASLPERPS